MTTLFGVLLLLAASDGGVAGQPIWSPATAEAFPTETREAFDAVIREWREGGPDDGLSVAVLEGDRVWLSGYGAANLSPRRAATSRTSYRIGSITKTFTAAEVLRLVEEGRVGLEDDVRTLVPAFPEKPWVVTLRELLGHTAGIGWYRSPRDGWTTRPTSTAQALDLFKDRPLAFEPGSAFLYSSYGYVLLGAAIEASTGQPYATTLERELWKPLGLSRTGPEASAKTQGDRASGYRIKNGRVQPALWLDVSSRFSSGGLRSTAEDLARWAHALMAGDVLQPTSWEAMTTPGVTTDGGVTDYGLGFAVYPVRGREVVVHAGGVPGAAALLVMVPEAHVAVVLLSNLQNRGPAQMDLAVRLSELLLDDGLPRHGWASARHGDEVAMDGFSRLLSHGLMRLRQAHPPSGATLNVAFARLGTLFDEHALEERPEEARLLLKQASTPKGERASAVAGAEMARLLEAHGYAVFDYLGFRGPAGFFVTYARVCAAVSCAHPLPPHVLALAKRLDAAWLETPVELLGLRREAWDAAPTAGVALEQLERLPGHIDLVDDLTRLAWRQRARGDVEASRRTLAQSARLHPFSPKARLALAEGAALDGEADVAVQHLRDALALRRPGVTAESVKSRAELLQPRATAAGVAALGNLITLAPRLFAERAREDEAGPTQAAPDADAAPPSPSPTAPAADSPGR